MTQPFRTHLAALAIVFAGLLAGPSVAARDDVIQAKVGVEMLSQEQQKVLWTRVERFASMESFAAFCGRPSNIERRVIGAVQACITPATLQQVISQFRKNLKEKNGSITADKSICQEARIKGLVKEIHTSIDTLVNEVTRMCQSCLIC
jgi:hypothetical protein